MNLSQMNPSIIIALITAAGIMGAAVGAALVRIYGDKKAAEYFRAAKEGIDTVTHMVDGHLKEALAKMVEALEVAAKAHQDAARLSGELAGRDHQRQHTEERQDKLADAVKPPVQ